GGSVPEPLGEGLPRQGVGGHEETSSCPPPYWHFLDYVDGLAELGEDGRSGCTEVARAKGMTGGTRGDENGVAGVGLEGQRGEATLVCITAGSRPRADKVLAMRLVDAGCRNGTSGRMNPKNYKEEEEEGKEPAELHLQHLRWPRQNMSQVGSTTFATMSRPPATGSVQGMCVCPAPPAAQVTVGARSHYPPALLGSGAGRGVGKPWRGKGAAPCGAGAAASAPYMTPVLMVLYDTGSVHCFTSPAHLRALEQKRRVDQAPTPATEPGAAGSTPGLGAGSRARAALPSPAQLVAPTSSMGAPTLGVYSPLAMTGISSGEA
ncbi:unnamed protein product, partial [Discosporangium mesarthrocarpum]